MQSKVAAKLARCNRPRWLKAGMETNVRPKFQIRDGFADIIIEGMWVHAEDIEFTTEILHKCAYWWTKLTLHHSTFFSCIELGKKYTFVNVEKLIPMYDFDNLSNFCAVLYPYFLPKF